jgi:hypothetical protein
MKEEADKTPEEIIAEYEAAKATNRNMKIFVGVAVIAVLAVFSSFGSSEENPPPFQNDSSNYSASSADVSWIPGGFTQWVDDYSIAWRWATAKEASCTYNSGSCWSAMVVTKNGCPSSLYGEINIFDKNDIQIDYTNDTTSMVQPMQTVKLTFDTFNEDSDGARMAKLKCY